MPLKEKSPINDRLEMVDALHKNEDCGISWKNF
jgi:hypothetical protein